MMKSSSQDKLLQNSIAMTVTLVSFGMLFASLFLGYFLVRMSSPVWPPVEIDGMPKLLPFLSTIVMGLSSLTYYKMEKTALVDELKGKIYWSITLGLGVLFLVFQTLLWSTLKASGILLSNGWVSSMVYAFTWIHAAHILAGLFALIWLAVFIFKKREKLNDIKLINVGKFWHFLGVIWVMIYLMMFVI